MAITWGNVIADPRWQPLSFEERDERRMQFWDSIVIPKLTGDDDPDILLSDFLARTQKDLGEGFQDISDTAFDELKTAARPEAEFEELMRQAQEQAFGEREPSFLERLRGGAEELFPAQEAQGGIGDYLRFAQNFATSLARLPIEATALPEQVFEHPVRTPLTMAWELLKFYPELVGKVGTAYLPAIMRPDLTYRMLGGTPEQRLAAYEEIDEARQEIFKHPLDLVFGIGITAAALRGLKGVANTRALVESLKKQGIPDSEISQLPEVILSEHLPKGKPKVVAELGKQVDEIAAALREPPKLKGLKSPGEEGFVKSVSAVPTKHHINIRKGELYAWQTKIKGAKRIKGTPHDRRMEIIYALQDPKRVKGLSAQERSIYVEVKRLNDKAVAINAEHKLIPMTQKNYFFQWWKDPETGRAYSPHYGEFSRTAPQAKRKKIPDYKTGVEKVGLKPATDNPYEIVGQFTSSMIRLHQTRELHKSLNSVPGVKGVMIKRTSRGKPQQSGLIERWDLLEKQKLTEGYERFDHPFLDKPIVWKDANGILNRIQGPIGIRQEYFHQLKAYVKRPTYGNLAQFVFALKAAKLFSLFHIGSLAQNQLALGRVPLSGIIRGNKLLMEGGPIVRRLYAQGAEAQVISKATTTPHDIGEILFTVKGGGVKSIAAALGNAVMAPLRLNAKLLFEIVQPGMKWSYMVDEFTRLRPIYKAKGWTEDQIARQVVQAADSFFSGEDYLRAALEANTVMARYYFSATGRKAFQMTFISPTWQREHIIAFKNSVKSLMPERLRRKVRLMPEELGAMESMYRRYVAGVAGYYAGANLYNWIATKKMDGEGKFMYQNPWGFKWNVRGWWDEPSYTVMDRNGKERTIKGGPAYWRPSKSHHEVPEFFADPFQKIGYKLAPLAGGLWDLTHQKYRRKGDATLDVYKRIGKEVALLPVKVAEPISVSAGIEYLRGRASVEKAVGSVIGFPVKKYSYSDMKSDQVVWLKDLLARGNVNQVNVEVREWNREHPDLEIRISDLKR
ncbi:hypothetical protein LCGC14_0412310 [marine sediment metagenome]|uniref:Large polyvalent protein associated domain-containing protein n=1 Tax=marine sediment metagenome TaxID=412755 RepID=A0A0F9STL3_9ZZZZ